MEFPLPNAKFVESLKGNTLMGLKCQQCGAYSGVPRGACLSCQSPKLQPVPLSGKGKVVTWTHIRVPPASHAEWKSYGVGIVELQEGARVFGLLQVEPEKVAAGMRVKAVPVPRGDGAVLGFVVDGP